MLHSSCQENGYSVPAAHSLADALQVYATPLSNASALMDGMDNVKVAVKQVYTAMKANANGFETSMYFTYVDNENFALVKSCWSVNNMADPYCKLAPATTQYIAYVRNIGVYGDAQRRVYTLTGTGDLGNVTSPWVTSKAYYPLQRSWAKRGLERGFAWTDPYVFASTGKLGISYASVVRNQTSGALIGVVGTSVGFAAGRAEPCTNGCLRNSFAGVGARTLASSIGSDSWDLSTTAAVSSAFKRLYAVCV